jgi:hypothetical protein
VSRDRRRQRFAGLPLLGPKTDALDETQAELWPRLGDIPDHFVLYGGTGLALRLGHRASVDFAFFSAQPFVPTDLVGELAWLGRVTINEAAPNTLMITTTDDVRLSFFGGMDIQSVAEPSVVDINGIVVASLFDLAGTKAKAILDRSEWKDYVDIAAAIRTGITLADVIGYATTIFEPRFDFPAATFLRSLAWFGDGTASEVPASIQRELEEAVAGVRPDDIPIVRPYSVSILP